MEKSVYMGDDVLERIEGLFWITLASGWDGSLKVSSVFSVILISEEGISIMLLFPKIPNLAV